jgi:hypothetical protein
LIVERPGDTPGAWTVQASIVKQMPATLPTAWVRGGADLTLTTPEVAPGRRMLRVAAAPGSLLRQMSIPYSLLEATSGPVPETGRPLVVRVRPSRLDRLQAGSTEPESATDSMPMPALGHVVTIPTGIPTVLDVPLDVIGIDVDGTAFARRIRTGVVVAVQGGAQFEMTEEPLLRVTGHIDKLYYRDGTITGVRVTDGRHARELHVRSAQLGAAIAAMDHSHTVLLGVRGTELERVFLPLAAALPVL